MKRKRSQPQDAASGFDGQVMRDALAGILMLAIIPTILGARGFGLLWFAAYTSVAAATLTGIAWIREHKHGQVTREDIILATLTRILLVFLIGGAFLIVGYLVFRPVDA